MFNQSVGTFYASCASATVRNPKTTKPRQLQPTCRDSPTTTNPNSYNPNRMPQTLTATTKVKYAGIVVGFRNHAERTWLTIPWFSSSLFQLCVRFGS